MTNYRYDTGGRDVYVANNGNDDHTGVSPLESKKTLAAAVTAASALTPSIGNGAAIIDPAYSRYIEGSTALPDDVQVFLPTSTIVGCIHAGARAQFKVQALITSGVGSEVAFDTTGKGRVGAAIDAVVTNGAGDTGILIGPGSDEVFVRTGQILNRASNSKCIEVTSDEENLEAINVDVCDMGDTTSNPSGCKGLSISTSATTPIVFRGGKIKSNSTAQDNIGAEISSGNAIINGTAFEMYNNPLAPLTSERAIVVKAGCTLTITSPYVSGNIVVETGGKLYANITDHFGTILANGEIVGWINNIQYGSTIADDGLSNSFIKHGDIPNAQGDTEIGYLSIDTSIDVTTKIYALYTQNTATPRTVHLEIADANNPATVYWTKAYVGSATPFGEFSIDIINDAVTPLPASQQVNLIIKAWRIAASGVSDMNVQYERSRA